MLTVRFNPPPGWPAPPTSWVPADDWLPEPEWPDPPVRWTFWTMDGEPDVPRGVRDLGRLSQVSFPVATVAAQSTVSLAALFPERGRRGGAVHGGYGSSMHASPGSGGPAGGGTYGSSAGAAFRGAARGSGVYKRSGREYYRPRGAFDAFDASALDGGHALAALEGTPVGADPAAVLDSRLRAPLPVVDRAATSAAVSTVRLSPLLRIVAHPSGFRVRFRLGGDVAAALTELMTPALVASAADRSEASVRPDPAQDGRPGRGPGERGGRERGIRMLLRRSRGEDGPAAGTTEQGIATIRSSRAAVATGDLLRRALAARRDGDQAAAARVEAELRSLHRQAFRPLRAPAPAPRASLSDADEEAILRRALDVESAAERGIEREEIQRRREVASERAAEVVRATRIARWVLSDRRRVIADGAWRLLREHDPATVVAVVDEAMRLSGSEVTCIDAGHDPATGRPYVSVLVRFPPPVVVPDEVLERTATGRHVWRPRTARERNVAYASGLASATLAAAKHVDSIAIASDAVRVVVVRPTPNGRSVEPIYVGTLDREDVSLRHPDADPMPLVVSSAVPGGLRVVGHQREVMALERSVDSDGSIADIVEACRRALHSAGAERMPGAGAQQA